MTKPFLYTIIAIFLAFFIYFQNYIQNLILSVFNWSKKEVISSYEITTAYLSSYRRQSHQIRLLKKENQEYQKFIENIYPILETYKKLKKFKFINNPKLVWTQTISYANLPDITSIYIDYKDNNFTIPKGVVYNHTTAGIVIKGFKNYSLVYLNSNPKTIYTVFIGKDKIPGILFGGKVIKIKYIPKYHKIKEGDLVVTSGLDKVFYEGVKVGKIDKIRKTDLYQEAIITPFYDSYHPTYFYVVKN
jgi:rod shape-determining protein MreC